MVIDDERSEAIAADRPAGGEPLVRFQTVLPFRSD
jgi:hypothetical protein